MNTVWLKAAGIRALKTFAQYAVALIGTSVLLDEVNWALVASGSALAAIVSLLMSIGGLPEVTAAREASLRDMEYQVDVANAARGIE